MIATTVTFTWVGVLVVLAIIVCVLVIWDRARRRR
jgi:hypothetical protein